MKRVETTIIKEIDRKYLDETNIISFVEFLFNKMSIDQNLELNLLFSDDEKIKSLNKQFKNKDESTDILSFYGYDGNIMGDIIISIETMEKDAKNSSREVFEYLLFLIAHGFLHLMGYTHETEKKYEEMINLQNKLVKEWKDEKGS
jgi:probable rRNA maturation factor